MPDHPSINWDTDEDIVVPRQMPIRVYLNAHDNVVICQESSLSDEDDPFIVMRPEYVPSVIAALTRLMQSGPKAVD